MLKKPLRQQKHPIAQAVLLCISLSTPMLVPSYSYAETATAEQSPVNSENTSAQQQSPYAQLNWEIGPKKENIANVATLNTIKGDGFLDY